MARIYHPLLDAYSEVPDDSVPAWENVGWQLAPEPLEVAPDAPTPVAPEGDSTPPVESNQEPSSTGPANEEE